MKQQLCFSRTESFNSFFYNYLLKFVGRGGTLVESMPLDLVCKNVFLSLYMYVGVQLCMHNAYMCVRLANDFINVKTETK